MVSSARTGLMALIIGSTHLMAQDPSPMNYRDAMRTFVGEISSRAKAHDPSFAVVIQNGQDLFTDNGEPSGTLRKDFLDSIDGLGREELFFGYEGNDDTPTHKAVTQRLIQMGRLARDAGLAVLVTDYASSPAHVSHSIKENLRWGFIPFVANQRELTSAPDLPLPFHSEDVEELKRAQNFLYLINPEDFSKRKTWLSFLKSQPHDLLIIDLEFNGSPLKNGEVHELKVKPGGGRRLTLAYLSIGEAEEYRDYWKKGWKGKHKPKWLKEANPQWPDNHIVDFWHSEWKAIVMDGPDSPLDRILRAGFDGVYLDLVDVYQVHESQGP